MASIDEQIENAMENSSAVNQFSVSDIPYHTHEGTASPNVSFQNLINRNEVLHVIIPGSSAATAANYGVFFIAPYPCVFVNAMEVHGAVGGTNAALQVEKLTGATASGSGTPLLMSAFDLTATANTVQTRSMGKLVNSVFNLATGDRLGLTTTGTLTNASQVVVVVKIMY